MGRIIGTINRETEQIKENRSYKRGVNLFNNKVDSAQVMNQLMSLVQLVVDNTKLHGIGILGITPTMLKVTAIMSGNGKSQQEIQQFFDNPVIQRIMNKIGEGKAGDIYHIDAYNTITSAIRTLETKDLIPDDEYTDKVAIALRNNIDRVKALSKNLSSSVGLAITESDELGTEPDEVVLDYDEPMNEKAKIDQQQTAKAKIISYDRVIAKLQKKLTNIKDTVDEQIKLRKESILKTNELYNNFLDTYILDRVTFFSSKYRGFDVDQYTLFDTIQTMKDYLGTGLNNFFQGKYTRQDNLDKIKHLKGFVSIGEDFGSMEKIGDYTTSFMDGFVGELRKNGLFNKVHIHSAGNK
jgi:hypothetical protein